MNKVEFNTTLDKVLWDINPKYRGNIPEDFLIKRILSHGGVFLIMGAIKKYGKNKIKEVFEKMPKGSFLPKKYLYIKNFILL